MAPTDKRVGGYFLKVEARTDQPFYPLGDRAPETPRRAASLLLAPLPC